MTTHNESPSTPSDDLPLVDPPARVSRPVRAYAGFLATGVGRWLAKNVAPKIDPWLLRATGGRLAMGLMLPSALLTTTGSRTGQPRTNPVFYFHDGPDVIVIASNYGADNTPLGPETSVQPPRADSQGTVAARRRPRTWSVSPPSESNSGPTADRATLLWPDYRWRARGAIAHPIYPPPRRRA